MMNSRDCTYAVDFKTYKKTKKLDLCDKLLNLSPKTRIQVQIYTNYTEEKIRLRPITIIIINKSQIQINH